MLSVYSGSGYGYLLITQLKRYYHRWNSLLLLFSDKRPSATDNSSQLAYTLCTVCQSDEDSGMIGILGCRRVEAPCGGGGVE